MVAMSGDMSLFTFFVFYRLFDMFFQRPSMLIQRFTSALITESFCFSDEDPDL